MRVQKILVFCLVCVLVISGFGIALSSSKGTDLARDETEGSNNLFAGGSGIPGDPYLIKNVTQLQAINEDLNAHYALANDINASETSKWNGGSGFMPVGENWANSFNGSLDGRNHTVSDLYIDRPNEGRVGLLGYNDDGVIKNIGLIDVNISGDWSVGGLVGYNSGTVKNSYGTGEISGNHNVGGLVGWNVGTVDNSCAEVNVSGNSSVGGLVGYNWGMVLNSYAAGNVSGNGNIGGLVGSNDEGCTVSNSYYNIDSVLINGGHHVTIGGLFDAQYQDWIEDMELDIQDYSDTLIPSGDHYEINSVEGLQDLLGFADKEGYDFHLSSDIDMSDNPGLYIPYLAADFDGDNHTISKLNIDLPFISHIGMFGYVKGGKVTNLEMVNVNIRSNEYVGGLVGENDEGTVLNSSAMGKVNGDSHIGMLVGGNGGTILNSSAAGNVSGNDQVGGLVGDNSGKVLNSYGAVDVSGDWRVGGLVGDNFGFSTVENSNATGKVSGDWCVGGLAGTNDGRVEKSYATGDVSGNDTLGGLVGFNSGMVKNSYARGEVTRLPGSSDISFGGFVGSNYRGKIINCYSTGRVTYEDSTDPTNKGFCGSVDIGEDYEMTGNFWDTETSGQTSTSGNATGKTTEEMKDFATYTDTDTERLDEPWDFVDDPNDDTGNKEIWDIDEDKEINDGYPFLACEEEKLDEYSLTINIDGNGTVEVDGKEIEDGWTGRFEEGTNVTLEAIPVQDENWDFDVWTGNVPDDEERKQINITMDSNKTITANFGESVSCPEDGGIPGFTTIILLMSVVIAVAIYHEKKR